MARPQSADFEDRKKDILRAAATLFAENGYSETLLEDIAERCGIKKSSIYHYHDSKHAILHGLITWKIEDLDAKVGAAVACADTPRAKLRTLVGILIDEYIRAPGEVTVLLTQVRYLEPDAMRAVAAIEDRIIRRVALLLQELRPAAEADRKTLTAQTMMLFGMVNWIHVWYKPSGAINPEELKDMLVSVFLDGFVNFPRLA